MQRGWPHAGWAYEGAGTWPGGCWSCRALLHLRFPGRLGDEAPDHASNRAVLARRRLFDKRAQVLVEGHAHLFATFGHQRSSSNIMRDSETAVIFAQRTERSVL